MPPTWHLCCAETALFSGQRPVSSTFSALPPAPPPLWSVCRPPGWGSRWRPDRLWEVCARAQLVQCVHSRRPQLWHTGRASPPG